MPFNKGGNKVSKVFCKSVSMYVLKHIIAGIMIVILSCTLTNISVTIFLIALLHRSLQEVAMFTEVDVMFASIFSLAGFLGISLNLFVLYCAYWKSPRHLREYRILIICSALTDLAYTISISLLQPRWSSFLVN
jgi:hypothetical protein